MKRSLTLGGLLFVVASAWFLVLVSGTAAPPQPPGPATTRGRFGVTGFLAAVPRAGASTAATFGRPIYVPGLEVTLENLLDGSKVGPVPTDLSGRFVFPPQPTARYRACWSGAGFVDGCSKTFSLADKHLHLGPLPITVKRGEGLKAFFGQVRLADHSLPRAFEPLANANAFAEVRVLAVGGVRSKRFAYVNNFGDYILPAVPATGTISLQARIENATTGTVFNPALIPGAFRRANFVLANHPPVIQGLVGASPAGKHWTAAVGDLVKVTARASDPNGDALEYRWILPDGSSVLHSAAGQTVAYQLPNRRGRYQFTAVVYDGKGGYDSENIAISTEGIRFAGTVAATDAPTIPGAQVEVNGAATTTDGAGYFQILVPESSRYVLNIRKEGYGLVSRIYTGGLTGGRWVLTRASVETVDPTVDIDVTNRRKPSDCPGSLSDRRKRRDQPRECGPGIRVRIRANTLVDEGGNPPAGPIKVFLTTNDLGAPDGMQGDYSASNTTGDQRVMESYGAGTVELAGGGHRYNLEPGATAEVVMPIEAKQLAAAGPIPPQIPLLSYDETAGIWRQEGTANRVGNAYVGKVKHFSAINMDQLKVGQACVRLEAVLMPPSFDLEMTVPSTGGGAPTVRTEPITNEEQRFHALYNLSPGQDIELRAFEAGTTTPIQFLQPPPAPPTEVLFVNTGSAQNPTTPNEPEFPYAACQTSIELTPALLPPTTADEFLHGLYNFQAANLTELDRLNPGDSGPFLAAAEAYYTTIDPKGFRRDLTDFNAKNGFPTGEVNAKYANSGDLGFGRDMHCRKSGLDVACYVTNYGDRFTDDLQDLIDANANFLPVATVGMEYSRIEDPAGDGSTFITGPGGGDLRVVKFYVFKEAVPSPVHAGEGNGRAASANLDAVGERPVPQLCMVCHGGRYPSSVSDPGGVPTWDPADPTSANLGSAFIPFDLVSLTTPNNAAQQARFKSLNRDIVLATNPPAATQAVIDAMYAPGGTAASQNTGFFVSGWASTARATPTDPNEQEVYAGVVAPSCRSCHISQGPTDIAWDVGATFKDTSGSFIASVVCDQHVMPHALVTHNRFWLSTNPHQPLRLHDFLNNADAPGTGTGNKCRQ